jgi:hypothetical protein
MKAAASRCGSISDAAAVEEPPNYMGTEGVVSWRYVRLGGEGI